MPSFQQVILMGHMGKDPDMRHMPSGGAVASFSVATTYAFKDKSGQYQKETEWHDVTFFGKSAEFIGKNATKGKLCFVQGRIKTNVWKTDQGVERRDKKIMGDKFELLTPNPNQGGQQQGQGGYPQQQGNYPAAAQQQTQDFSDDIPF